MYTPKKINCFLKPIKATKGSIKKLNKSMAIGLALSLGASTVYAKEATLDLEKAQEELIKMQLQINPQTVIELPASSFSAIDYEGQLNFISNTGRFVIMGQLYDVLAQRFIDTSEDLRAVAERIEFDKLHINFDDLTSFYLGDATNPLVVSFVDPLSKASLDLIKDMEKLASDYRFIIVAIPALGDASNELTKKLSCTEDKALAFKALKEGTVAKLDAPTECDNQKNNLTLMTVHMLHVNGVPFTVAPNGMVARGYVENLIPWLEGNTHAPMQFNQ